MQGAMFPSQDLTRVSVITKTRDIPVLQLKDLKGLEATGKLTLFEGIEQCTLANGDRIKIAKSPVASAIALLLQNCQEKEQCASWEDVKRNCTKGPPVGVCFDCRRQNCR